ncbi:nuclear transport factor 2 family protein [Haliea sp. E17]|uniref:nuclear transport factor 2 family protein n=1 Tax=Haliea sp. E17 TaxID=3401576 RepID=UPI003AAC7227
MTETESARYLEARQAITDQIYRYCRAVDRLDPELGHSLWHSESYADYGDYYRGDGPGLIDQICAQHRETVGHSHQVSNILVDVDGDRAGSEAYVTARVRVQQDGRLMELTLCSRYIDQWSEREGRWALNRRTALIDLEDIREVTPMGNPTGQGSRDRNDPSYAVLGAASSHD